MINYTDLKTEVLDKYNKAKNSIKIAQAVFNLNEQAISNNIPNYDIKKLEFGAYKKDSFVSFFALFYFYYSMFVLWINGIKT